MPTPSRAKVINIADLRHACSSCSVRELCLPMGLDRDDLARLDAIINRRQQVRTGQHLYHARDRFQSLYAIRTGLFKTYELNNEGGEQISGFHMNGELMGLDAISGDTHACNAVALEDSEVCVIPFNLLEGLLHQVPILQKHFHKLMSREIATDHRLMMILGTMAAEERLASFLVNLSERLAARGHPATTLRLGMSREEIGNYLGLTLETVSRMFSKFQEDGLLQVERRNLILKDLAALRRIGDCSKKVNIQ